MATARNRAADDDGAGTDTQSSGFTEEQRGELAAMIAEAVGGAKPPAGGAAPAAAAPRVSDDEWDRMSDRQRESWVRELVDFQLSELVRFDDEAKLRADVDQLKADKTPEPEAAPSVVTRLQKLLWGDEKK